MNVPSFTSLLLGGVLSALGVLGAPVATAEDIPNARDQAAANTAAAPLRVLPGFAAPVKESQLAAMRGGAEVIVVNQQDLSARMSNTSASNLTTGSNTINDGSFANSNGLPIVIQNSGNGVIIQNSTILNLNLK
jgi:hypothetical protein